MALNYSHRPIFPAHLSEDNLASPMRIVNGYLVKGIPERSGDGFVETWSFNKGTQNSFDCGQDSMDKNGSRASKDIVDLLPSDPFGMDMSTTFTALTGWLEDLKVDYGGFECNNSENRGDCELYAGFNLIWNKKFQSFPSNHQFVGNSSSARQVGNESAQHKHNNVVFLANTFEPVPSFLNARNLSNETTSSATEQAHERMEVPETYYDGHGYDGLIHPALPFALSFLGVRDLLSVESACRSLRSTVQSDSLLWRTIIIDHLLSERITDELLLKLTARAQGNLLCLSLIECPKITDDGLRRVLQTNLKLTKLCVSGCTRLSIEGIVSNLKEFKSSGALGIKHLRIGGRYGVTYELFNELKILLGFDMITNTLNPHKPHYYHIANSLDDARPIDIEVCPICQKLRLVYDCPAKTCQDKGDGSHPCRACKLCIPRCVNCGRCINDNEYEETFCLEWLCSDCSKQQLLESPDRNDGFLGHEVMEESYSNNLIHG